VANQLQQLVKNTSETEKKLSSVNETLVKIYNVEVKEVKLANRRLTTENTRRKREEQEKKRTFADTLIHQEKKKKEEKKEKKTFLETLGEGLTSSIGGLINVLGSLGGMLTSALGALTFPLLGTALATTLAGAIGIYLWNNKDKLWTLGKEIINPTKSENLGDVREKHEEYRNETKSESFDRESEEGKETIRKKKYAKKLEDLIEKENNLKNYQERIEENLEKDKSEVPWWVHWGDFDGWKRRMEYKHGEHEKELEEQAELINAEIKPAKEILGIDLTKRQDGGLIPTMVESGEALIPRDHPDAAMGLLMNSIIPRFNEGGEVGGNTLEKLTHRGSEEDGTEATAIGTMLNMAQGFGSMISTVWEGLGFTDMLGGIFNTAASAAGDMLGGLGSTVDGMFSGATDTVFGGPVAAAGATAPPARLQRIQSAQ